MSYKVNFGLKCLSRFFLIFDLMGRGCGVELCCDWLEHEKFYGATSAYIAD